MSDDGIDWPDGSDTEHDNPMTDYPEAKADLPPREYPDNPYNHRYTISVTGSGAPMVVVRANTAAECNAAFNELESYGVWANIGAAHAALKAQGALGSGLGPVTPVAAPQAPAVPAGAPPAGYGQGAMPQQYPPQMGPQTPGTAPSGWQNAGAPPQQNWGGQQQQQGNRGPKPQPSGWWKLDVPWARKDEFKAVREANKDFFKGKVSWGGGGTYWVEPSIVGWFQQQGYPMST